MYLCSTEHSKIFWIYGYIGTFYGFHVCNFCQSAIITEMCQAWHDWLRRLQTTHASPTNMSHGHHRATCEVGAWKRREKARNLKSALSCECMVQARHNLIDWCGFKQCIHHRQNMSSYLLNVPSLRLGPQFWPVSPYNSNWPDRSCRPRKWTLLRPSGTLNSYPVPPI